MFFCPKKGLLVILRHVVDESAVPNVPNRMVRIEALYFVDRCDLSVSNYASISYRSSIGRLLKVPSSYPISIQRETTH